VHGSIRLDRLLPPCFHPAGQSCQLPTAGSRVPPTRSPPPRRVEAHTGRWPFFFWPCPDKAALAAWPPPAASGSSAATATVTATVTVTICPVERRPQQQPSVSLPLSSFARPSADPPERRGPRCRALHRRPSIRLCDRANSCSVLSDMQPHVRTNGGAPTLP